MLLILNVFRRYDYQLLIMQNYLYMMTYANKRYVTFTQKYVNFTYLYDNFM